HACKPDEFCESKCRIDGRCGIRCSETLENHGFQVRYLGGQSRHGLVATCLPDARAQGRRQIEKVAYRTSKIAATAWQRAVSATRHGIPSANVFAQRRQDAQAYLFVEGQTDFS